MQRETVDLAAAEDGSDELSNADRAINVVKRKLASRLSPEADVRRLVLEATDVGNLSRMFNGPSPWAMLFLMNRLGGILLRWSTGPGKFS